MEGWLWAIAVLGVVIALLAVRRSFKLAEEINRLKREQYYAEAKLKRIPEEIKETVEPLRLQLAKVAAGKSVPPEMILNGRLYLDVSAEEAQRVIEQEQGQGPGKILLVDVRTPREYAAKRLVGSMLVPFEELEQRYKTDIPETAEKVFVYCAGGERSRFACDFLSRQGYTNLYHLRDGIQGWRGPTEGEGQLNLIQIQHTR
ncbi:MAG: rhodanese-like domain-containing protein [Nitrospirae bacterium]|nr:rhodanese-like domain-containing protein [Nitrospirota bacterium]